MARIIASIISSIVYFLILFKKGKGIIVLMYHRVNDSLPANELVVSSKTFKKQMEFLKSNGYRAIELKEMMQHLKSGIAGSIVQNEKLVVVTFDDGYRDNYLNAYPILKELGLPAVVFLTAGMIGTDKKRPRYADLPAPDMLKWEEIKIMQQNGIEFGAHTMNHPHLSEIPLEDAKKEIEESKNILQSKTGKNIDSFCYPYGDFDENVKKLIKDSGFNCAFSVKPGKNSPGCDIFEIKRTGINGKDSIFDFKKKLHGAFDLLHILAQKYNFFKNKKNIKYNHSNKLNVLYIIWSLGLGGAERVVINLAKNIDKTKFNPIICCLNDKGAFTQELESIGIKVIALNKKGPLDFSIIGKIIKIIKENNIAIINTHLWGANLWGRIAAFKAKTPVVIATEHNEDTWKKNFHFNLDKLLSRKTDKIIAVSNSVKDFYIHKGINKNKIEVIYNGINFIEKNPDKQKLKDEFKIAPDEVVLAIIGRLVPQKGHKYIFEAVKSLERYKIKLLVIGSGPLSEELVALAEKMSLKNKVIFAGLRKDVPEILHIVNIAVMPSLREGFPIVALEAMATGVPVIASSVGGTIELIDNDKTGILVPATDVPALEKAISKLIDNPEVREEMGRAAKQKIKNDFSIEKMARKTEELYMELYSKKIGQ